MRPPGRIFAFDEQAEVRAGGTTTFAEWVDRVESL